MAQVQVLPKLDFSKYVGQWILLCEDKIVDHNKELKKIKDSITKCKRAPTIVKIPEEGTLIF